MLLGLHFTSEKCPDILLARVIRGTADSAFLPFLRREYQLRNKLQSKERIRYFQCVSDGRCQSHGYLAVGEHRRLIPAAPPL